MKTDLIETSVETSFRFPMDAMGKRSYQAALAANAEDASVWRWFAYLLEERRIRWRFQCGRWIVHVDREEVATEPTFDSAIRCAMTVAGERGIGLLDTDIN